MSWGALIGALFKVFLLAWKRRMEREAERKEELAVAAAEVDEGIKTRDPSMITAGFDRANSA